MINLELVRLEFSPTEVLGVLLVDGKLFCWVLEPPQRDNRVGESCIPRGRYVAKRYDSAKFGCPCVALYNVPGRSFISMHPGNTGADTRGCLLSGVVTGYIGGKRAVLQSKQAMAALMTLVTGDAMIMIRNGF